MKTIPEIANQLPSLHEALDDLIVSHTELEHTAQMCAQLAMTANGDRNIDFNCNRSAGKMAQIEDLLSRAAVLYMEIAEQEKRAS